MKLKIFTMILAISLLLTGCGERSGGMNAEPSQAPGGFQWADEPETSVAPPVTMPEEPLKTDDGAEPTGGAPEITEPPTEPEKPTVVPTETPTETPTEAPATSQEIAGIIAMIADMSSGRIEVVSLDPETGRFQTVSLFTKTMRNDAEYRYWLPGIQLFQSYYSTYRDYFSDDYTLLAITRYTNSNHEGHAGWIDQRGDFFDVTEALGLQSKSDFDDPVMYTALGFCGDRFVYRCGNNFFSVPVDNVSTETVTEGDPFWSIDMRSLVSDWLDEDTYLVDELLDGYGRRDASKLVDGGQKTDYIPGSSRYNWNGVFSPDGQSVAFLSAPKQGSGGTDIYIMPLGGDPVKLENDLPFPTKGRCAKMATNEKYVGLLDWK